MKSKGFTVTSILAGIVACAVLFSIGQVLAATVHYNDGSAVGGSAQWQEWTEKWRTVAADFTGVSLTPGKDETELNFAWYSKDEGTATPVVHFGTNKDELKAVTGTSAAVDASLTDNVPYVYNYVTVGSGGI